MDKKEYLSVKDLTYLEYCDYLQNKYGIGLTDYMTKSFCAKKECRRTKDGLIAHHKAEDKMILLSTEEVARQCPFEWQKKDNIVYCDYLEHLLLHVLICKYPSPDKFPLANVGYGGVVNFIIPELNDVYSGWETKQQWRKTCYDKVINDKETYLLIIKQFIVVELGIDKKFDIKILFSSFNENHNLWSNKYNKKIHKEIYDIYKSCKKIKQG